MSPVGVVGLLNYITVAHTPLDYRDDLGFPNLYFWTQYCHLAKGSEKEFGIKMTERVSAGQPIARTGKTGWTDRDHLHFMAFSKDHGHGKYGFTSRVPSFK